MPGRSPSLATRNTNSPRRAYMRILRAISEIAAAMTVWSAGENPNSAARSRPSCLALTTSLSVATSSRRSSAGMVDAFARLLVQERESLFQIERRRDALEGQPQLDHRERHFRLDAHDDRLGAPQPRHVRDIAERPHGKRVHYVERGHVHDDAARAVASDLRDQGLAQL